MFDKCLLIGEIAQAHDGSLGNALRMIDLVADAGFDAVKFQIHFAEDESTLDDEFRVKFSQADATRFHYWQRVEFNESEWGKLFDHARAVGLIPFASVFSERAFNLAVELQNPIWKIASGEIFHKPLISLIESMPEPILASNGLDDESAAFDNLISSLKASDRLVIPLDCISNYPSGLDQVNPDKWKSLQRKFGVFGFSDHSGNWMTSAYAISKGARVIEVHVRISEYQFGPDTTSSLGLADLRRLREFRDLSVTLDSVTRNVVEDIASKDRVRLIFGRSIALKKDFPKGHLLEEIDLIAKKPGGGIGWSDRAQVIGKKLKVDKSRLRLLRKEDLE